MRHYFIQLNHSLKILFVIKKNQFYFYFHMVFPIKLIIDKEKSDYDRK